MTDEKIIRVCEHCGNHTIFDIRAEYNYEIHDERSDTSEYTKWRILQCFSCHRPVFIENSFWDGDSYSEPEDATLYPIIKEAPISLLSLPKEIKKEYEETLKVQPISKVACAVLARRTLEAIVTHESAVGNSLMDKVNDLLQSKSIPPLLAEVAHLGRKIGNVGAHFNEQEVTDVEISVMLEFLEIILQYLYVMPARVIQIKERLVSDF